MQCGAICSFVVSLVLGGLAFLVVSQILPGFRVKGGFRDAVIVAFVYGVLKALLQKLLIFLTLPIVVVTFGLFIFVINAFLLWLTNKLLGKLQVKSFTRLVIAAALLSLVDILFHLLLRRGAYF